MRVLEQIKIDVCYESLPVVFIGDGAGVVYGQLGASHQSTEDVAALRALPNIKILSPADRHEMTACMKLAITDGGPVYLRMGKADLGDVHSSAPTLKWGQPICLRRGAGPVAWLATGSMVQTALTVASEFTGSAVWSVPSIKPLSAAAIAEICGQHEVVVVLEEHSIYGGLCSAVAEIAAAKSLTWICAIGVQDRFSQCCGTHAYLMNEHGLDAASVTARVKEFIRNTEKTKHRKSDRTIRQAA